MWPYILLSIYCVLIVLASLAGGWMPFVVRLTHARMHLMMSGVAGLMLGVGLFHMLPHSFAMTGSLDQSVWWMMIGLLTMFLLIRVFDFHQHGVAEESEIDSDNTHDHDAGSEHMHSHHQHFGEEASTTSRLGWIGVACGLALHTFIDGVALGAGVIVEVVASHTESFGLFGFGVFLAIVLHKPLDAMSITALMKAGGWPVVWMKAINVSFALMCPLGAGLFLFSFDRLTGSQGDVLVGCALGFSAGVFLCISLGDLLPELQFHKHDRFKLSAALLLGVVLAYGIHLVEGKHLHVNPNDADVKPASEQIPGI
ncbi:MAG: ZIP family metal transporter [Planctomycetes bacterium]|nr:ZIP family metal transporter [Planctomycetota bacterium]